MDMMDIEGEIFMVKMSLTVIVNSLFSTFHAMGEKKGVKVAVYVSIFVSSEHDISKLTKSDCLD